MPKFISILSCAFFFCRLPAQSISANDTDEPEKIFSERIFIHTNKSTFVAGDTVWFKAYLFNGNYPGSASTDFYIDLINESGNFIDSKKLPVFDGTVYGNFSLPDTMEHGFYFLRAYTRLLISQGKKSGILKSFSVLNPGNIPVKYRNALKPEYKIEFFPESGSFAQELINTIAFKATDQSGNGINIDGVLYDKAGDTVLNFKDTYKGLGSFSFTPAISGQYHAEVIFPGGLKRKFDLPVLSKEGVLLSVAESSRGKIFQVQKTDILNNLKGNLELTGYMFNKIVFREELKFTGNTAEGLIPVKNLPGGVMHLTVTDNNKISFANRSVFVHRSDLTTPLSVKTDTLSFLPKAKNIFTLIFPDSLDGNFSVSVTPYNERFEILRNNSITSSVFLDAEKETPLSSESDELTKPDKQSKIINDLYLMTEKQQPAQEIIDDEKGVSEHYIQISGRLYKEGTSKPVNSGELLFLMQTKDSASAFTKAPVQQDGSFILNNLVYDDSAKFYYQLSGKKAGIVEIKLDKPRDSLRVTPHSTAYISSALPCSRMIIWDSSGRKEMFEQKEFLVNSKQNKVLEEVVVNVRRKKPIDIVNKKYTSGLFSSMMNAKVFDFVNEPPPRGGQNIFDYLQGRVAGLRIDRRGGNYSLVTNRAMSLTGGPIAVQLFLNEMPADPYMLTSLTLDQIALVKYFPAGTNVMVGFGIAGKLVIYTKLPEDFKFDDAHVNIFFYSGYTAVQEFTHKEYINEDKIKKDNRTTLYWNPDASISSGEKEFKIRFYNSDNAKKFKIVVQGFTYDGRLIDFEKVIE
jgi:hypothetical protein